MTTPVTWDAIKALLLASGAMSNRQIAEALDAQHNDVMQLTSLMVKAGELSARHVWEKPTSQRATRLFEVAL